MLATCRFVERAMCPPSASHLPVLAEVKVTAASNGDTIVASVRPTLPVWLPTNFGWLP
jgi:hypothetical protein